MESGLFTPMPFSENIVIAMFLLKRWYMILSHTVIIIMIIISMFKEDNVFSMNVNLPYGPSMNIDNDYYRTFLSDFFVSDAILISCPIIVRRSRTKTKQIAYKTSKRNWRESV